MAQTSITYTVFLRAKLKKENNAIKITKISSNEKSVIPQRFSSTCFVSKYTDHVYEYKGPVHSIHRPYFNFKIKAIKIFLSKITIIAIFENQKNILPTTE